MQEHRRGEQVRRFFAGVTEYVFHTRLGVADPPMVDYISELLTRFLRSEEVYAIRGPRGARLTQVADMLEEASHRRPLRRCSAADRGRLRSRVPDERHADRHGETRPVASCHPEPSGEGSSSSR